MTVCVCTTPAAAQLSCMRTWQGWYSKNKNRGLQAVKLQVPILCFTASALVPNTADAAGQPPSKHGSCPEKGEWNGGIES